MSSHVCTVTIDAPSRANLEQQADFLEEISRLLKRSNALNASACVLQAAELYRNLAREVAFPLEDGGVVDLISKGGTA